MPYTVGPGGILQATIVQRMFQQTVLNIYCYKIDSGASIDGVDQIDAFDAWFNHQNGVMGGHTQLQGSDLLYTDVLYQWIHPTRFAYLRFPPIAENGNEPGDMLPQNVAAAILRRTELAGPEEHGVSHLAGMITADALAGSWTAAAMNRLGVLALRMTATIELLGNSFVPVLFHRPLPGASRQIINAHALTTTRVVRRRTVGVGI